MNRRLPVRFKKIACRIAFFQSAGYTTSPPLKEGCGFEGTQGSFPVNAFGNNGGVSFFGLLRQRLLPPRPPFSKGGTTNGKAFFVFFKSRLIKTTWLLVLFQIGFSGIALAQDSLPYLKSATFYLAVNGWVDVYVNGIPIIESQRSTPESKGIQITTDIPEHLCYFRDENVLAIENSNAYNERSTLKNQIGFAYVLKLRFSDGSEITLSSNDLGEHRSYYIPSREAGEPQDWHHLSFGDEGWSAPYALGMTIPGIATLSDPETHQEIQFLSASGPTFKARFPGERHLYRREFHLNIGPNPLCPPGKFTVAEKPMRRVPVVYPTATPTTEMVWMAPTFTPSPTEMPRPLFIWTPSPVPTATSVPIEAPIWTPVPAVPILVPTRTLLPAATSTAVPTSVEIAPKRAKLRKPTPTPFPNFEVPGRVEPMEEEAPEMPRRTETPVPTLGVTSEPTRDQAQTIVFESQPANIYISFADGPGVYGLEVVDASLRHVRALFEKRIVAQPDDWVEWDGKDDAGRDMPAGLYTVLYTKDGRALNKLILVKEPQ